LAATKARAVIVPPDVETKGRPSIALKNPPYGWARILEIIDKEKSTRPSGVHPTAVVAETARLGRRVAVGAFTVVEEGAEVGDDTILYPHCYIGAHTRVGRDCLFHPRVTVRERVVIGDRCIFQPGVVIGSDGFGFTAHNGRHYKIPQVGTVWIGEDVEIQANTTVDRAAVGATRIGNGTKIDNLVQIAHNVEIGEHCLIVALTGLAGSVKLGHHVTLAAQVGVAGHLTIGDGVMCGAKGGISHNIKPKEVVWGVPAHPLKDELKVLAAIRKLPPLLDEFKQIKKKVGM